MCIHICNFFVTGPPPNRCRVTSDRMDVSVPCVVAEAAISILFFMEGNCCTPRTLCAAAEQLRKASLSGLEWRERSRAGQPASAFPRATLKRP